MPGLGTGWFNSGVSQLTWLCCSIHRSGITGRTRCKACARSGRRRVNGSLDSWSISALYKAWHGVSQISRNWADLVKRARAKQLAPDEFQSGTFTISNLGNFGADTFDAILPPGVLIFYHRPSLRCKMMQQRLQRPMLLLASRSSTLPDAVKNPFRQLEVSDDSTEAQHGQVGLPEHAIGALLL
jgi:hypothetical protein